MQLQKDAEVLKANGDKVGTVERVVLDPDTQEITHYVVSKGLLLTTEKVIPVGKAKSSPGGKVILKEGVEDFDQFPDFEESYYLDAEGEKVKETDPEFVIPHMYFYPPMGAWWTGGGYVYFDKPGYVKKTEKNIPEGTVVLNEGAKVIAKDGEHVGDVERVMTDPLEARASHFVISEGLILKDKKVIPTNWISKVNEDEVHLSVNAKIVENLPEYKE